MSKMRPATAKILFHSEGLGTPNVDLVRQRAEEIALINGRTEHTEADWQQAKYEIHGTHHVDDEPAEEMGAAEMVSGQDMLSSDVGHHMPKLAMEDDGNVVEELIREGMEEAEHEQMLESCREQNAAAEGEEKED
jgi:hypothetical protein